MKPEPFKDYHFVFERHTADTLRLVILHEDVTGAKCVEEVVEFDMTARFKDMRDGALTCSVVYPGTIDQFHRSFDRDMTEYKTRPERWRGSIAYYEARIDEFVLIED